MRTDTTTTDASTIRASLIELDLPGTPAPIAPAPIPVIVAAPAPTASTWERHVVSEASAALVATEQTLLAEYGLANGDTWFADGVLLAESGQAYARDAVATYAVLPDADVGSVAHTAVIAAERRRDREIVLPDWRLDDNGMFVGPGGVKTRITPTAWPRLIEQAPDDVAVPSNVNSWIKRAAAKPRVARVRDGGNGERDTYALVSTKYAALDSDRVLARVAKAMPGTKVQVSYDRATTRMRARLYIQAPIDVPSFLGVGRVHQAGVQISTRDDGLGSLAADGFVQRIRCLNHSLSATHTATMRRRHLGNVDELVTLVDEVVGALPTLIAELRDVWAQAAIQHYVDEASGQRLSVTEAIERLVAHGHLPLNGERTQGAVDRYMDAWRAEDSPSSAAGIVMAVQRAAHEGGWRTKWADEACETAASALLYQGVSWALPEIAA